MDLGQVSRNGQPTRLASPIGLVEARLGEALWQNGHTLVGKECYKVSGGGGVSPWMFNESPGILGNWRRHFLEKCFGVILFGNQGQLPGYAEVWWNSGEDAKHESNKQQKIKGTDLA
eukprot:scaffold14118_cov18-Tisochrysis_lutea.AAC.3